MGIAIYTVEEANSIEWNEYIKKTTSPIIKKTVHIGNIRFLADGKEIEFKKDRILSDSIDIYTKHGDDFITMKEARKLGKYNKGFFYNMPNVLDFVIEIAYEQTWTKLDTSKNDKYKVIEKKVHDETGSNSPHSSYNFLIYDDIKKPLKADDSLLNWFSGVTMSAVNCAEKRYLKIDNNYLLTYLLIEQYRFIYGADLTIRRFKESKILSERDINGGVVYVDILNDNKGFHILSDVMH